MSPEFAKKTLKIVSSLAFSIMIGATYKVGKRVDEKIDEHFTAEPETTEQPEN